ncbi:protein phosphatase 2C domain-containing protein [Streptomyces sp. ID05-04B]|uniref:PP2C family serine/threonine-protein phosphatase n=1 Tax=unclassified Streptomyces TaxID=2593676 RepID=UPI000D1AF528|nr:MULTISPECIES: protein phosphatase 2C domain-containing protein [unclassified Streptomyces]AVV42558.1 serine/threonine protein phosphatase [Streptomyces sp. P3]MDX5565140.1 protein phosphatase 2C domain-containing protein [Streptomyces sp. ID05-04B]
MSQMPRQAALPTCPSCAEPLDAGDRFCGACGYDLSVVPPSPDDHPTLTMNGSALPAPPETGGAVHEAREARRAQEPPPGTATAPGVPGAPGAPGVPGTLTAPGVSGVSAGSGAFAGSGVSGAPGVGDVCGVRFDRPAAEPDEYALQAPDPRVAAEAAVVAESAKVCVACRAGRVDDDGYCENCGHAQPRERDHMELESGPIAAVSDRGLRHHRNEDAFGLGCTALPDGSPALVAIVCDGVSSATRPDDASLAASKAARETLLAVLPRGTHPQQAMHEAIVAASHAVNALAEEPATAREHAPHQNAPACTLVGSVVTAGLLVVGWVGDSRAYWVPADRSSPPARLTEDDSWAAQMVAAGLMNEAEAYADERAHAITGWLGADAYELEPHTASFKPDRPGVVVVCTDGLWNYAEAAQEMAGVVPPDASARPLHSARVLVGHALDGGGHDNVTVAVVPFPAPAQGAGSA